MESDTSFHSILSLGPPLLEPFPFRTRLSCVEELLAAIGVLLQSRNGRFGALICGGGMEHFLLLEIDPALDDLCSPVN